MKTTKGISDVILESEIENQPIILQGSICYIYAMWKQASIK